MIKLISVVQILGGVLGISALIINGKSEGPILILGVGFLFFCFSFICGILLFLYETERSKLFTKINQAIQIIGFSILGVGAYNYDSGIYCSIGLDFINESLLFFNFGLSSSFHFEISNNTIDNNLMINIIPLFFYLYLHNQE